MKQTWSMYIVQRPFLYYPVNLLLEETSYLWTKILLTCSSNRFLICSETVLTNSTSVSMQKSRWNLNRRLSNGWLFNRSFKMAVAPKANEIPRLTNGRDNLHRVSRLLISGGAELLTAGVHQFLSQLYYQLDYWERFAVSSWDLRLLKN